MKLKLTLILTVTALGSTLATSCSERVLYSQVTPTFSSILANTIQPKCLQCHTSLATYEGVLATVVPGDPQRSRFFTEVQSGSMPQYSPSLSDQEISAIQQWIQNGAPND